MPWGEERIIGRVWWCQDETCDCTQALIEKITPNFEAGPPWIIRERLWSGTFYTNSWERPWKDRKKPSPEEELQAHLAEYGAVLEE